MSRFNPVRLMGTGGYLLAGFAVLQSFAIGFWSLFGARLFFVISQSGTVPGRPLMVRQWLALRHIGLANGMGFALHSTFQALAVSVLPLIIAALGGWRPTYLVLASMTAGSATLWFIVARNRQDGISRGLSTGERPPIATIFRHKQVWLIAAAQIAPGIQWTSMLTFLPSYLRDERGIPLSIAGVSLGMLWWGVAASGLLGGVAERTVRNRKLLIAIAGILFCLCGIGILFAQSSWLVAVLAFLLGCGWLITPISQTVPYHLPGIKPRELSLLAAFLGTNIGLSFALGPILSGFVAQYSGSLFAALLFPSLLCVATIIIGVAYPNERPGVPEAAPAASGAR
jgi:predicted MFS family arabinose efflux permease